MSDKPPLTDDLRRRIAQLPGCRYSIWKVENDE